MILRMTSAHNVVTKGLPPTTASKRRRPVAFIFTASSLMLLLLLLLLSLSNQITFTAATPSTDDDEEPRRRNATITATATHHISSYNAIKSDTIINNNDNNSSSGSATAANDGHISSSDTLTTTATAATPTSMTIIVEEEEPHYIIGGSVSSSSSSTGAGIKTTKLVRVDDESILCDTTSNSSTHSNKEGEECKTARLTPDDLLRESIAPSSDSDSIMIAEIAHAAFEAQKEAGFPSDRFVVSSTPTISSPSEGKELAEEEGQDDIEQSYYVSQSSLIYGQQQSSDEGGEGDSMPSFSHWRVINVTPIGVSTSDSLLWGEPMFFVVLTVSVLGFMICAGLLWYYLDKRRTKEIALSDWRFTSAFIVGCALLNLSSLTYLGPITSDSICLLRMWAFPICFVLTLSPLLVKVWRMYRLVGSAVQAKRQSISNTKTMMYTLPAILLQVLILTMFTIFDPATKHTYVDYDMDGSSMSSPQQHCICKHETNAFVIVEIIFEGGLVLMGCVLSYLTWNICSTIGDSRPLLFAMYNISLVALNIMLVDFIITDKQMTTVYVMMTIGVFWASVFSSCAFVIPRLVQEKQRRMSSRGGSLSCTNSGFLGGGGSSRYLHRGEGSSTSRRSSPDFYSGFGDNSTSVEFTPSSSAIDTECSGSNSYRRRSSLRLSMARRQSFTTRPSFSPSMMAGHSATTGMRRNSMSHNSFCHLKPPVRHKTKRSSSMDDIDKMRLRTTKQNTSLNSSLSRYHQRRRNSTAGVVIDNSRSNNGGHTNNTSKANVKEGVLSAMKEAARSVEFCMDDDSSDDDLKKITMKKDSSKIVIPPMNSFNAAWRIDKSNTSGSSSNHHSSDNAAIQEEEEDGDNTTSTKVNTDNDIEEGSTSSSEEHEQKTSLSAIKAARTAAVMQKILNSSATTTTTATTSNDDATITNSTTNIIPTKAQHRKSRRRSASSIDFKLVPESRLESTIEDNCYIENNDNSNNEDCVIDENENENEINSSNHNKNVLLANPTVFMNRSNSMDNISSSISISSGGSSSNNSSHKSYFDINPYDAINKIRSTLNNYTTEAAAKEDNNAKKYNKYDDTHHDIEEGNVAAEENDDTSTVEDDIRNMISQHTKTILSKTILLSSFNATTTEPSIIQ